MMLMVDEVEPRIIAMSLGLHIMVTYVRTWGMRLQKFRDLAGKTLIDILQRYSRNFN